MFMCDFSGWHPTPNGKGKVACFVIGWKRYLVVGLSTLSPRLRVGIHGYNDGWPVPAAWT